MRNDGIIIDGFAGLEHVVFTPVNNQQFPLEHQNEFFALMRTGFAFAAVGENTDVERLHVAVVLALAQRLVGIARPRDAACVQGFFTFA